MSKSARKKHNTKEGFQFICTQVVSIDSVYRKNENYYLKVFLEKCNLMILKILMKKVLMKKF